MTHTAPTATTGDSTDGGQGGPSRSEPASRRRDSAATRRRRHPRTPRQKALYFVRDVVIILVVAVLASFLIKTYLVRSFYIPSGSMENTLQINDRIIVNELEPRLMPIQRGDVVVFSDPGGWLPPTPPTHENPVSSAINSALGFVGLTAPDSSDHLIKRVIGLPGDKVSCCNALGQLSVNGVPIKEPYVLLPPGTTAVSGDSFSVTVPKGMLWVMGDNRYNSADSRYNRDKPYHGFVPEKDVVGRAILITWPVNRWTWLSNYESAFAGVPTRSSG